MPKLLKNALTARGVQTLAKPGTYADGGGLSLVVKPSGAKSWVLRVNVNGKAIMRGLGVYPEVTLADARGNAASYKEALLNGNDPMIEKKSKAATIPTFDVLAAQVIDLRRPTWSSDRHATQWVESLRLHASPTIGHKRVDTISTADVLACLMPIWNTKAETASRVQQRVKTVMDFAVAQGWIASNPANGALNAALPKRPRLKAHHPALPYAGVPAAITAVRESTADATTKLAFEFLVLTGARSSEVRGLTWAEIDLDALTWVVPAARMKARREHRVPLSDRAVAVLLEARELNDGNGLVFPGKRSKDGMLSDMAFTMLLRRCEVDAVPHGFRSSFRDWMGERTSASWAIAEAALAHATGERASLGYFRSDLLEERRPVMQQWADFLEGCIA